MNVGLLVSGRDAPAYVDAIKQAEELGIDCAWMTSGGVAPDPLTIFAAAARETTRINFGTAIIQTFPRHPLALVQQAIVLDQLAPGRLRLGVGPSGPLIIERAFGLPFERPQEHLREYVTILRQALTGGETNFNGKRLRAHARLAAPTGVRVMAAALRAKAFELCGELADGAISWLCPAPYIRDVARPALEAGAKAAGRPTPPLVGHVLVACTTDAAAARDAVRNGPLAMFPRVQTYQDMFADAGHADARQGAWSDSLVDAVTIHGDVATLERGLRGLRDFGFDEIMATVLPVAGDPEAHGRALRVLGRVATHQ